MGSNWNGSPLQAKELLEQALEKHPDFPKVRKINYFHKSLSLLLQLWMMRGQLEEEIGDVMVARDVYSRGVSLSHTHAIFVPTVNVRIPINVKRIPASVPIWLLLSRLEERSGRSHDYHVTPI